MKQRSGAKVAPLETGSTTVCVNCLNQPGARVEIDVTAIIPK